MARQAKPKGQLQTCLVFRVWSLGFSGGISTRIVVVTIIASDYVPIVWQDASGVLWMKDSRLKSSYKGWGFVGLDGFPLGHGFQFR